MSQHSETEPEAEAGPKEGDIVAGKYRVERVLGRGGMGVVVAAEHTQLRQKVAIKMLLPDAAKRDDATARFLREARASVSIQSEHVARVMDVDTLDTGEPFMVMELLRGSDLGEIITKRGAIPPAEAIDYILQASEAIAEAHALGIIHRDLKPANLFLSSRADGSALVKVLDFGLSKPTRADAFEASLTQANVVMGSPFYMSPEQIRSLKGLTTRSDIWSLGVILYQLLAGVRPFDADGLAELFLKIGAEPTPPLRSVRPDVSPDLEAVVHRCLEKDAAKRPQTVAELARALAPFGNDYARISVERIHRVLSDDTFSGKQSPITITPQLQPGEMSTTVPLPIDDHAATVALDPSQMPPMATSPLPAPQGPPPPSQPDKVSSRSMAALATPVGPPASESTPSGASNAVPPRKKRGLVLGLVAVVALSGAIGVVALRMRGATDAGHLAPVKPAATAPVDPPPQPTMAETAAPAPTTTAAADTAPTAVPADTAAPALSASAPLPAPPPAAASAAVKPRKAPSTLRAPAPPAPPKKR